MKFMARISGLLAMVFFLSCSGSGPHVTVSGDGAGRSRRLVGSEIPVSIATDDQQNPHTIYLPDKNLWFVVYEDWSGRLSTGSDMKGNFFDSNGSQCGGVVTVTNANGNQTAPWAAYRDGAVQSVSADTTDRIVVTWQDTRGTTTEGYVYFA